MSEGLRLQCILFEKRQNSAEFYYFSELTTLEVTTLIDDSSELSRCDVFAYTKDETLDSDVCNNFRSIEEFNRFFINHPEYHFHDVSLHFVDGSELGTHDDGEVHLLCGSTCITSEVVLNILRIKRLPDNLMQYAKETPGLYLSFDSLGKVVGRYESFDEYREASD